MTKSNTEIMAAKAHAELLRRKYTVSREESTLSVGLGEFHNIVQVDVEKDDLDTPLSEFCDEVEKSFNDYLDALHEQQTRIIDEVAGEFDEVVRPVTFPTFLRNAFVEARSERLKRAAKDRED